MSPHRYWRVNLIAADGGQTIELTEFALLSDGSRVDIGVIPTITPSVLTGSVASLQDSSTATIVTLNSKTSLQWDFGGSPVEVGDVRIGSADTPGTFARHAVLQHSDDGISWTTYDEIIAIAWPGPRTLTASGPRGVWSETYSAVAGAASFDKTGLIATVQDYRGVVKAGPARSSGVQQFEVTMLNDPESSHACVGVCLLDYSVANSPPGFVAGAWTWRAPYLSQPKFGNAGAQEDYGSNFLDGDVVGVVVDFDNGDLEFFINGVSQGVVGSGFDSRTVVPCVGMFNSGGPQFVIETANLQFPAVGATPWESNGRIETGVFVSIAAPLFVSAPVPPPDRYDLASGIPISRSLKYLLFDPFARGRIVGTVKRKDTPSNIPLARRVRLYRDVDGMFIAETWSNDNGDYVFEYIEEGMAYTAIAYDHTHFYRAVAADNLTLANGGVELM